MPKLRSLVSRWRKLAGPAPLSDFTDYDEYWDKRGGTRTIYRRWQIAAEHITDNSTVLDVGCGNGEFLQYLKSVRPSVQSHGVDVSQRAVERARASGLNVDVLNVSECDISGTYDFVTCFEVMEHMPDAEVVLQRLTRAFQQQLIVSVPNIGYIGCRMRLAVFGRFPITNCIMHVKEHLRHWTTKDFHEWVRHYGLRVVRAEGQYGVTLTPWRKWSSLFASGMVYVLEHVEGADTTTSRPSAPPPQDGE